MRSESEQIYVDRDEALAALEQRLQRRRDYFAKGKDKGFDEDDDFWARGLANWAEESGLPTLEDARALGSGSSPSWPAPSRPRTRRSFASSSATATRTDRKLAPREHEQVATAAQQIQEALKLPAPSSSRLRARRRAP